MHCTEYTFSLRLHLVILLFRSSHRTSGNAMVRWSPGAVPASRISGVTAAGSRSNWRRWGKSRPPTVRLQLSRRVGGGEKSEKTKRNEGRTEKMGLEARAWPKFRIYAPDKSPGRWPMTKVIEKMLDGSGRPIWSFPGPVFFLSDRRPRRPMVRWFAGATAVKAATAVVSRSSWRTFGRSVRRSVPSVPYGRMAARCPGVWWQKEVDLIWFLDWKRSGCG